MNLEQAYRDLLVKREQKEEVKGTLVGTCLEFCPYFEYIERTLRGDINKYEKDILVKKYNRSSAGKTKAFPEDVRPINVLKDTLFYILNFCHNDYSLELYKFLENRTRAIRLDIAIQELDCDLTIQILEIICRFHILFNYALSEVEGFEEHLNLEQIKKILSTLRDLYNRRSIKFVNEDEFMTYYYLISFDDKFFFSKQNKKQLQITTKINKYDFGELWNLKEAYLQNNMYKYFIQARKFDFLSYCIIHSFFNMIRLKGLEMYCKCFVEKIEKEFIKKLLYVTDIELLNLCDKLNIKIDNERVDFKNKDIFENDKPVLKEKKENLGMNRPFLLIYMGNLDYKIFKYIRKMWIRYFIQSEIKKSSEIDMELYLNKHNPSHVSEFKNILSSNTRLECENTELNNNILQQAQSNKMKQKIYFFENKKDTENDLYRVLLKIYAKAISQNFIKDVKKKLVVFERKKELTRKICFYILDLYIKKISKKYLSKMGYAKYKEYMPDNSRALIIVTDNSIFSAIFVNKVKKSDLMSLDPEFINIKEINVNELLKYKFTVFSVSKNNIEDIENRFYMLNKIVDTPQNLGSQLENIKNRAIKAKRIIKNKLNNILESKGRIKQISIVTHLYENKKNKINLEDLLIKIDKKERIDNIDVYYEEDYKLL